MLSIFLEETTTNETQHVVVQPSWKGDLPAANATNATISTGSDDDDIGRPVRNNVSPTWYFENATVNVKCSSGGTHLTISTMGWKDVNGQYAY